MKVLIGFSRCPITVTLLRQRGVEAWTCDLRAADHPWHIQGDIWDVAGQAWDWGIFHPMCTYLTCSAAWAFCDPDFTRYPGVGYHQRIKPGTLTGVERREARASALADVRRIMALPYPKAIENPATSFISAAIRRPDQVIQPYEFGDDASKATGLWLDRLPPLVIRIADRRPGRVVQWRGKMVERWANQTDSGQNRVTPSADRWLARSQTYPGIGRAMAQWAGLAMEGAA
ncbi:hypothetical protein PE067_09295 [Paracoccus sp. DMF-8]|uniref:hypothetical protein n=1 Tax=Paracoccus sp. DMF-8 TaxID=3019445 RepID=UPI0023E8B8EF|nr:hypothetical protein [Paracoccus sp. DMF-8]MDF3606313.1 hypothetical protein [Paracoccus sp. DMF-8]